jgi:PAS domain S-box-containing protein
MNAWETIPGNENAVSLASVITTAELSRRPSHSPDFAAENRALVGLAQVMGGLPDQILQKLAETALNLCSAHSAGFSLLDLDGRRFCLPVIAGQWACHMEAGALVNRGPSATVLGRNAPQLMSRPERHFAYLASVKPPIAEVLIVPFYREGQAIGTLWVMSHDETLRFDAEDLRVMTNLSAFATPAYQLMLNSGERLREANAHIASGLAQIQKVNAEVQDSRRAALNVMEDALPARRIAETLNQQLVNEVAERMRSEATLRESEERYRMLFTLGPVAVYSCDDSGVIRDFNPRAAELWGRTPKPGDTDERFCGSYKMYRPDGTFMPHDQCPMAEVLSGRITEARDGEVHIERPDGTWVIVIVNIRPLKNQGGKITGALNYFFDITARKQAEALMESQKQTFELASTGVPLMQVLEFWVQAAESHAGKRAMVAIHLLNEQGTRFGQTAGANLPAGYRRAIEGMEVCSVAGPCGAAISRRQRVVVADLAASEEFAEFASFALPLGIRAGWSAPILSSNGKVLGTVAKYYEDLELPQDELLGEIVTRTAATIIEGRRAEDARGALVALVQSSDDAIISKDLNGVIQSWNSGAERLFGYTAQEAIGQSITILIPPDHANEEPSILERIRRGERIEHYETIRRRKDGTMVDISLTVSPIINEHSQIVGASKIARDITERKRIELERRDFEKAEKALAVATALREKEAELARVSRALSVGELATSIAHEVNQPLAAIVTNAEAGLRWLNAKAPEVHEAQESLALIVRDGNRASQVIHRIREFLKKDSQQIAPVDICAVVQEAVALVHGDLLKRQAVLRLELSDGLPPVRGDRIRLQQVILNLIMNGSEAMASPTNESRELTVIAQRSGADGVLVAVRDSGTGVDSQNAERIFDAFFTTKPAGMGMGLSISRSIIEAHGGRIWASPNDGPGLTVQFTLPIEAETPLPMMQDLL